MEIFRIRLNSNEFQSFLPVDASIWQTDVLKMDCKSKLSTWKPPEVYIQNPKRERGNFFHLCRARLLWIPRPRERLRTVFEMTGELLPLACEGLAYYLLNVLECVNCLDQRETERVLGKTTGRQGPGPRNTTSIRADCPSQHCLNFQKQRRRKSCALPAKRSRRRI